MPRKVYATEEERITAKRESQKKCRERAKEWTKKNKDRVKFKIKEWHQKNKDKISNYRKVNRIAYQAYSLKRRDLKIKLSEYVSKNFIDQVYNRFGCKCFKCGLVDKLSIDHHYPLSLGNPLTLNNAVLLCKSCNSSKSNKLPEAFYSPEQLTDLQLNYGISKSPLKEEQPSLFEARMPKNLERDNGLFEAMNAA